jgi:type II secretory pathway pseudopilin PulG
MKKGFTLAELIIVSVILILSITMLMSFAFVYLSTLNSIKIRYLALNVAQTGIEYIIALRNKQIETNSSPWAGVSQSGNYCLSFNTTTRQINVTTTTNSLGCQTEIPGYTRLISYSDFQNLTTNLINATSIRAVSEVYFREGRDSIKLDIVLTKWHPVQ